MKLIFVSWLAYFGFVCGSYNIVREYAGQNFFSAWDFYGNYDNQTEGDVIWVDQQNSSSLAFVNPAGNAIVKVDNTTNVPYYIKRNSVRITSQDFYSVGSVFIIDILHLPYGCSVWPSIWTKGPNWPNDGEIDIIEGVNLMTSNQMALHTAPGCTHTTPQDQTGASGVADCSQGTGCVVTESAMASYGAAFASAQGGVFAAQFDVSGIYIWFWSRASIPASISSLTSTSPVDTSSWGNPSAAYPASSCNISEFFSPQQLIIDITLCGNWAGVESIYQETCHTTPTGNCTNDNVYGPGSPTYDNAYFEIQHIRVYSAQTPSTIGNLTSTAGAVSGSKTSSSTRPASTSRSAATNERLLIGSTGIVSVLSAIGAFGIGVLLL